MFREILTEPQQALLELLTRIGEVRTFYLPGGTALALHLGHRRSRDFNLFRAKEFLPQDLLFALRDAGEVRVLQEAAGTLNATLRGTLLGGDPGVEPLKSVLIGRTEGNPFFLEESVRTLIETSVLAGERGAYRLAKPADAIQVPATVQAILAARIDRLPPEEKRLLQAASVIGKDVPFALLVATADGPEEKLRRGLGRLQAAEFLYETSLFPDPEYTFKHALTHEVRSRAGQAVKRPGRVR